MAKNQNIAIHLQSPMCGKRLKGVADLSWLVELQRFAARYIHYGIGPDLSALSLFELHGLYFWFSR